MKKTRRFLICMALAAIAPVAHSQSRGLTTDLPDCRMPATKVLPDKYYVLAKENKEFAWVRKARADDQEISGNGWERIDGSSMFSWFAFSRVDLNNDGLCDWFLHAGAPISTGGDRDSINTLYLGRTGGWRRIGASIPGNKPDELGFGKTEDEQHRYLFGEEIAVIHDADSKVNYLIGAFYDRHVQRDSLPGYRIHVWDAGTNTLRMLDKWEPASKVAQVYAFFKAHGAHTPSAKKTAPEDAILRFDFQVEDIEIEQACNPDSPQRSSPGLYGAVSRHLLARCKAQAKNGRE